MKYNITKTQYDYIIEEKKKKSKIILELESIKKNSHPSITNDLIEFKLNDLIQKKIITEDDSNKFKSLI